MGILARMAAAITTIASSTLETRVHITISRPHSTNKLSTTGGSPSQMTIRNIPNMSCLDPSMELMVTMKLA